MKQQEMQDKLDELYIRFDDMRKKTESARVEKHEQLKSDLDEARGRVADARDRAERSGDEHKSKLNSELIKLQMRADKIKADLDAARAERDRKRDLEAVEEQEALALELIAYAASAVDAAACASLDAIDARLTYTEQYGEAE